MHTVSLREQFHLVRSNCLIRITHLVLEVPWRITKPGSFRTWLLPRMGRCTTLPVGFEGSQRAGLCQPMGAEKKIRVGEEYGQQARRGRLGMGARVQARGAGLQQGCAGIAGMPKTGPRAKRAEPGGHVVCCKHDRPTTREVYPQTMYTSCSPYGTISLTRRNSCIARSALGQCWPVENALLPCLTVSD